MANVDECVKEVLEQFQFAGIPVFKGGYGNGPAS